MKTTFFRFLFHQSSQQRARTQGKSAARRKLLCALTLGFVMATPNIFHPVRALAETVASEQTPSKPSPDSADSSANPTIFDDAATSAAPAVDASIAASATDADVINADAINANNDNANNDDTVNAAANEAATPDAVDGATPDANVGAAGNADAVEANAALQAQELQRAAAKQEAEDTARRHREENRKRSIERQARIEAEMRRTMNRLGCTEAPVQDAIIAYIAEETRARRPLRDQSRRLFSALRAQGDEGQKPAQDIERLLADFRIALEQDKARHGLGETVLDQKINFRNNPRLESMLLLFGVIGDGPSFFPTRDGAPQPQYQIEEKRLRSTTPPSTTPEVATPSEAAPNHAAYAVQPPTDGTIPTPAK